jgi:hypothetical protein
VKRRGGENEDEGRASGKGGGERGRSEGCQTGMDGGVEPSLLRGALRELRRMSLTSSQDRLTS